MIDESDEKLVNLFKKGQEEAFEVILQRYERVLLNYLFAQLPELEVCRDICQDTFLKLIKSPPSFLFGGKLKPWLFKVARNKLMDHYRKCGKNQLVDTDILQFVPDSSQNPSDSLTISESYQELQNAVQKLPDIYKEVVSLHIFAEMTFKEVAKVMKIPLGTALWRMQKALKILKEEMQSSPHKEPSL